MLNWIWLSFILLAVVVGGLGGHLPEMTKGAFETAETAVMKIALPLIGIWAIWLGMMRLAEKSGLVQLLARALRPLMRLLFPEVPAGHPALGAMVLNMAANMLGLGNAATPLGLRAMAQLERINPHPGTATNAMCTFLAINTASIQLIPTTAIGILAVAKSREPWAIVPTAFLATTVAAVSGVVAAKVLQGLPMFRPPAPTGVAAPPGPAPEVEAEQAELFATLPPLSMGRRAVLLAYFAVMIGVFAVVLRQASANSAWWLAPLNAMSILAVPFLLSFFPLYAACRGLPVYEQFVEGAKEAFGTAQRVIPYLVAMLISISLLRNAGVIDAVTRALRGPLALLGFPAELLPMVLMRPLSGSGTQSLFVDLVNNPAIGPDSFTARLAATIYGSTETTFYVLAVYFGAVAIRRTRHAVAVGLIADSVAVAASVAVCHLFFRA